MRIEGYEQGMAKRFTPKCDSEYVSSGDFQCDCGSYHDDDFDGKIFLPHSCSEWILGDDEQVQLLIADLQSLIEK